MNKSSWPTDQHPMSHSLGCYHRETWLFQGLPRWLFQLLHPWSCAKNRCALAWTLEKFFLELLVAICHWAIRNRKLGWIDVRFLNDPETSEAAFMHYLENTWKHRVYNLLATMAGFRGRVDEQQQRVVVQVLQHILWGLSTPPSSNDHLIVTYFVRFCL